MSQSLPLRANLEWLKKLCKERFATLRANDPHARLSDAQLAVAREYGFASWRRLKAYVDQIRQKLGKVPMADPAEPLAEPTDPELGQLLTAVYAGDTLLVIQLLQRRPILVRSHGPDGQTPLHAAAQCNDPRLAVYLLTFGADVDAKYGSSGHTALSWAVTCKSIEFAKTLVRLGVKPDLFCAAGMGSIEHVREYFDEAGNLLPDAAKTGSSRFAPDGARLPCPPTTSTEQISDALCMACRNAHAEVVRFLLGKPVDSSFRSYMGATALHWAYFGGSPVVIELLRQAGPDAAARDDVLRCTPRSFGICTPANWGFDLLVRRRLAEDPTLANPMDEQTSPLHEAARGGHVEIVRLLLSAGADPMYLDARGKTPLDVALECRYTSVAALLQEA